jgi:hypothetical protein
LPVPPNNLQKLHHQLISNNSSKTGKPTFVGFDQAINESTIRQNLQWSKALKIHLWLNYDCTPTQWRRINQNINRKILGHSVFSRMINLTWSTNSEFQCIFKMLKRLLLFITSHNSDDRESNYKCADNGFFRMMCWGIALWTQPRLDRRTL